MLEAIQKGLDESAKEEAEARRYAADCSASDTPETNSMCWASADDEDCSRAIGLCRKLERERNAAFRKLDHTQSELHECKRACLLLAMMASDTPQFYNPVMAMEAKGIRDSILSQNAQVLPLAAKD